MSLLIPEILPDEFAPGYLGRIGILNGISNPRTVQRLVHEQACATKTENWNPPLVFTLAELAKKAPADFTRNHTLVPFYSVVRDSGGCNPYGQREARTSMYKLGLKSEASGPYHCTACLKEDLQFWGFAYWRRSHQVPGITHCIKHFTKLASANPATFRELPRMLEGAFSDDGEEFQVEAALVKYSEISSGLMELSSPLTRMHVTRCLADRARSLGIRGVPGGNRPLLSDLALESMPRAWLERFFPSIAHKSKGSFVHPFDCICISGCKPMKPACYPLAATLLYQTADEALKELCGGSKDLSPRHKSSSCLPRLDHRRAQLQQAYVDCDGNFSMAHNKLGLSRAGAVVAFRNAGLPSIARTPNSVCQALLSVFSGTPFDQACKDHEADPAQVLALLVDGARPFMATLQEINRRTNGFRKRIKRSLKNN